MVLNNKPQMFCLYFSQNFFYPNVVEKWSPIIERMKLPYQSLDDFMNQQIQTFTFPSLNLDVVQQQRGQYTVNYTGGKELEAIINRDLTITFKLTESYLSYMIMFDQLDTYLHYFRLHNETEIWMNPIHLSFLSDEGFELIKFTYNEITPTALSDCNLSYAAQIASYSTFTFGMKYNYFDIS